MFPPQPTGSWFVAGLQGFGYGAASVGNAFSKTLTFGAVNFDEGISRLGDDLYVPDDAQRATQIFANIGANAAVAAAASSTLASLGKMPGVGRVLASPVSQAIGRGLTSRPVQGGLLAVNSGNAAVNGAAAIDAALDGRWLDALERGVLAIENAAGARGNAKGLKAGFVTPKTTRAHWIDSKVVHGKKVYPRDDLIDVNHIAPDGRTNLQRMRQGFAPLGPDGRPINLHHLTQTDDSAIAEITETMHRRYRDVLHINPPGTPSDIDRSAFNAWRRDYWRLRASGF